MKLRVFRAHMRLVRKTAATFVVGPPPDVDSVVRTIYLEKRDLPSRIPDYVVVRVIVDESGAAARFTQFLEERVDRDDSSAVVTIGQIWAAWAAMHGADADEKTIEDIKREDVAELFRDRFNEGEQTRAKIDGRSQRCWRGYRIVDSGSQK